MISNISKVFAFASGFIFASAIASVSAANPPTKMAKRLDHAAQYFSGSKVYSLDVEKDVVSELMGTTKTSTGQIFIGGGHFRWETLTPEKSLTVFDGKTIWTQQPTLDEKAPPLVTKSTLDGKNKDRVLVKLLAHGKISDNFKISDSKNEEGMTIVNLDPVTPDPSVKNFAAVIGGKPEKLKEIRYTDDVGNLTKIKILKSAVVKAPDENLFQYKAPKGAQVNEL